MQLPAPIMEQAPAGNGRAETTPQGQPEQGMAGSPEQAAGSAAQAMPMPVIPLPAPPAIPVMTQPGVVSNTSSSSTPPIADDGDLIEKEWVNKAKQIVDRTRDDPYRQSEQLTGVKVDYMQKRYGKAIKTSK